MSKKCQTCGCPIFETAVNGIIADFLEVLKMMQCVGKGGMTIVATCSQCKEEYPEWSAVSNLICPTCRSRRAVDSWIRNHQLSTEA